MMVGKYKRVKSIQEGDIVKACWVTGSPLVGMVIRRPQDTGDCWEIVTDEGEVHAINPISSSLEVIVREKDKEASSPKEEWEMTIDEFARCRRELECEDLVWKHKEIVIEAIKQGHIIPFYTLEDVFGRHWQESLLSIINSVKEQELKQQIDKVNNKLSLYEKEWPGHDYPEKCAGVRLGISYAKKVIRDVLGEGEKEV